MKTTLALLAWVLAAPAFAQSTGEARCLDPDRSEAATEFVKCVQHAALAEADDGRKTPEAAATAALTYPGCHDFEVASDAVVATCDLLTGKQGSLTAAEAALEQRARQGAVESVKAARAGPKR